MTVYLNPVGVLKPLILVIGRLKNFHKFLFLNFLLVSALASIQFCEMGV